MKLLVILISTVISYPVLGFAQSYQDKQTVIQMALDLNELQQYYPETDIYINGTVSRSPVRILNNGIVPANLVLHKFGERVLIMYLEQLFFEDVQELFEFDKFSISTTDAVVHFHSKVVGVKVELLYTKSDDGWLIVNKRLLNID